MNKFSLPSSIKYQCKVSQYVQYTFGTVQNICTKREVKKKEGRQIHRVLDNSQKKLTKCSTEVTGTAQRQNDRHKHKC